MWQKMSWPEETADVTETAEITEGIRKWEQSNKEPGTRWCSLTSGGEHSKYLWESSKTIVTKEESQANASITRWEARRSNAERLGNRTDEQHLWAVMGGKRANVQLEELCHRRVIIWQDHIRSPVISFISRGKSKETHLPAFPLSLVNISWTQKSDLSLQSVNQRTSLSCLNDFPSLLKWNPKPARPYMTRLQPASLTSSGDTLLPVLAPVTFTSSSPQTQLVCPCLRAFAHAVFSICNSFPSNICMIYFLTFFKSRKRLSLSSKSYRNKYI